MKKSLLWYLFFMYIILRSCRSLALLYWSCMCTARQSLSMTLSAIHQCVIKSVGVFEQLTVHTNWNSHNQAWIFMFPFFPFKNFSQPARFPAYLKFTWAQKLSHFDLDFLLPDTLFQLVEHCTFHQNLLDRKAKKWWTNGDFLSALLSV